MDLSDLQSLLEHGVCSHVHGRERVFGWREIHQRATRKRLEVREVVAQVRIAHVVLTLGEREDRLLTIGRV